MFIEESKYPNTYKEAGELMCGSNEKITFTAHEFDKLNLEAKCNLFKIPDAFEHGGAGFRMKLNSPFTRVFQEK